MEFSNIGLDTIGCDFLEITATPVLEKAERSCSGLVEGSLILDK